MSTATLRSYIRVLLLVLMSWLVLLSSPVLAAGNLDIVAAARKQIGQTLIYDPSYESIAYPMGDVALKRGVCSDVVIRALRGVDVDLQRLVHEDMKKNFSRYPRNWSLSKTDTNIDHRRVPNLATYFKRQGKAVSVTKVSTDYLPGDVVAWRLDNGRPHIGIISDAKDRLSSRPLVIHNIGLGAREEDMLFDYEITGHYRWFTE